MPEMLHIMHVAFPSYTHPSPDRGKKLDDISSKEKISQTYIREKAHSLFGLKSAKMNTLNSGEEGYGKSQAKKGEVELDLGGNKRGGGW